LLIRRVSVSFPHDFQRVILACSEHRLFGSDNGSLHSGADKTEALFSAFFEVQLTLAASGIIQSLCFATDYYFVPNIPRHFFASEYQFHAQRIATPLWIVTVEVVC